MTVITMQVLCDGSGSSWFYWQLGLLRAGTAGRHCRVAAVGDFCGKLFIFCFVPLPFYASLLAQFQFQFKAPRWGIASFMGVIKIKMYIIQIYISI